MASVSFGRLLIAGKEGAPEVEFPIDKKLVLIGRDQSCDIWIRNRTISRKHAELFVDDSGAVFINSLGQDPVRLNSQPVTSPQELFSGDRIDVRLDDRTRTFFFQGDDETIRIQQPLARPQPLGQHNATTPLRGEVGPKKEPEGPFVHGRSSRKRDRPTGPDSELIASASQGGPLSGSPQRKKPSTTNAGRAIPAPPPPPPLPPRGGSLGKLVPGLPMAPRAVTVNRQPLPMRAAFVPDPAQLQALRAGLRKAGGPFNGKAPKPKQVAIAIEAQGAEELSSKTLPGSGPGQEAEQTKDQRPEQMKEQETPHQAADVSAGKTVAVRANINVRSGPPGTPEGALEDATVSLFLRHGSVVAASHGTAPIPVDLAGRDTVSFAEWGLGRAPSQCVGGGSVARSADKNKAPCPSEKDHHLASSLVPLLEWNASQKTDVVADVGQPQVESQHNGKTSAVEDTVPEDVARSSQLVSDAMSPVVSDKVAGDSRSPKVMLATSGGGSTVSATRTPARTPARPTAGVAAAAQTPRSNLRRLSYPGLHTLPPSASGPRFSFASPTPVPALAAASASTVGRPARSGVLLRTEAAPSSRLFASSPAGGGYVSPAGVPPTPGALLRAPAPTPTAAGDEAPDVPALDAHAVVCALAEVLMGSQSVTVSLPAELLRTPQEGSAPSGGYKVTVTPLPKKWAEENQQSGGAGGASGAEEDGSGKSGAFNQQVEVVPKETSVESDHAGSHDDDGTDEHGRVASRSASQREGVNRTPMSAAHQTVVSKSTVGSSVRAVTTSAPEEEEVPTPRARVLIVGTPGSHAASSRRATSVSRVNDGDVRTMATPLFVRVPGSEGRTEVTTTIASPAVARNSVSVSTADQVTTTKTEENTVLTHDGARSDAGGAMAYIEALRWEVRQSETARRAAVSRAIRFRKAARAMETALLRERSRRLQLERVIREALAAQADDAQEKEAQVRNPSERPMELVPGIGSLVVAGTSSGADEAAPHHPAEKDALHTTIVRSSGPASHPAPRVVVCGQRDSRNPPRTAADRVVVLWPRCGASSSPSGCLRSAAGPMVVGRESLLPSSSAMRVVADGCQRSVVVVRPRHVEEERSPTRLTTKGSVVVVTHPVRPTVGHSQTYHQVQAPISSSPRAPTTSSIRGALGRRARASLGRVELPGWLHGEEDALFYASLSKETAVLCSDEDEEEEENVMMRTVGETAGQHPVGEEPYANNTATQPNVDGGAVTVERQEEVETFRAAAPAIQAGTQSMPAVDMAEPGLENTEVEDVCGVCGAAEEGDVLILCDSCDAACHLGCARPRLKSVPAGDWFCQDCTKARKNMTDSTKLDDGDDNQEDGDVKDESQGTTTTTRSTTRQKKQQAKQTSRTNKEENVHGSASSRATTRGGKKSTVLNAEEVLQEDQLSRRPATRVSRGTDEEPKTTTQRGKKRDLRSGSLQLSLSSVMAAESTPVKSPRTKKSRGAKVAAAKEHDGAAGTSVRTRRSKALQAKVEEDTARSGRTRQGAAKAAQESNAPATRSASGRASRRR